MSYHEHESLLENQAGEELSEEERKAAWEDFENEKKGFSKLIRYVCICMVDSLLLHDLLSCFHGIAVTSKTDKLSLSQSTTESQCLPLPLHIQLMPSPSPHLI